MMSAGQLMIGGFLSLIVLTTLALLFVETGSKVAADTLAVLVIKPSVERVTVARIVITALVWAFNVPRLKTSGFLPELVPCEAEAETRASPAESVSFTITAAAVSG